MKKCVILLSGGQDSTTCLAFMRDQGWECHAISFDYGQRHVHELNCARQIAHLGGCASHQIIPLHMPESALSALLTQQDVNAPHPLNANLPASFVPGRNLLFLTYAAMHAFGLGIDTLVIGVSQEDYSGYPDCRYPFIREAQKTITTAFETPIIIKTPLIHRTKAETIQLMHHLNKLHWYKYTHTCYNGKYPPCGECPACKLRAKGFIEACIPDPLLEEYYEQTREA